MKKIILILLCGISMGFAYNDCSQEQREYERALDNLALAQQYAYTHPNQISHQSAFARAQAEVRKAQARLEICLMKLGR
ncbi:hypothetical protein [Helicobacter pullorum]|uniref:hypothetical protein n=1 Tax=Helicobacter pullorum TaxID=35818 RepID=UPI00081682D7|nr:hypothetical protein [Helicobacter pullorum]OCR15310.1 hypothetical protein BA916_05090 [Helicobacter pullorum]